MPHQPAQVLQPLTAQTDRKELLILACAVDRVAWRKICRATATRRNTRHVAGEMLGYLDLFGRFLPGYVGRWLRRANFVAQLGRTFGWLRS